MNMKQRSVLCLTLALLALPIMAEGPAAAAPRKPDPEVEIVIRSSPAATYRSSVRVRSGKWAGWLQSLKPAQHAPSSIPYSIVEVSVGEGNRKRIFQWMEEDRMLVPAGAETPAVEAYSPSDKLAERLEALTKALWRNHYGAALDWPAANRLLPKGTVMTITDMETGLSFRGQRRAGSEHADVQPVTKADSAVMKTIYGGEWSWNRRAVLLDTPEGPVAASMHGMPHGGDGIPDNNFNGHFCIHFRGTVTHGSGHSDPAHQAMVHKAAGLLEEYHKSLTPEGIVDLFIVASNQKDPHLLNIMLEPESGPASPLAQEWLDERLTVRRVAPVEEKPSPELADALTWRSVTRLNVWRRGSRPHAVSYEWSFRRTASGEPWTVTSIDPVPAVK